jgi:hypothetical protein
MKKMLTHHTPRKKKNERKSQKRTKNIENSKFSLVVILRRRKNESAKNFAFTRGLTTKSQKRGEKKLSSVSL